MKAWIHWVEIVAASAALGGADYAVQALTAATPGDAHAWRAFGVGFATAAVAGAVNRVRGIMAGVVKGVDLASQASKGGV